MVTSSTIFVQDQFVTMYLMNDRGVSRREAMKIWLYSKTRHEIHDKHSEDFVAPTRCYEELLLELNSDSEWMTCDFE